MNYYQHHIGDYRRDTAHLSLLEHGIYRQLLDTYYLTEEPIPEETQLVCRRLSAKTEEEIKAVETILSEFFYRENGWKHKRCDMELRGYKEKADTARENGKLGGRPRKTHPVISGLAKETQIKANHEPLTINQEPNITTLSGKPDVSPVPEKNLEAKASAKRVLEFLNEKTGRAYRPVPVNIEKIVARMKEGATEGQCRQVIAKKSREWSTDERMVMYLRPATLFNREKFAQYVGELV